MKLAVTADLHFGLSRRGDAATLALRDAVRDLAPDVLCIAGDLGEGAHFGPCLALFADLPAVRLLVPGNHDLWTRDPTAGASLRRYERDLPRITAEHGFRYLDQQPYVAGAEAVVGSINWYDYSFADPSLESEYRDVHAMYRQKLFPGARHNDGRFVHLGMPDGEFTSHVVARFQRQLADLPDTVERIIALQHHPPVRELFYPTDASTPTQRFWLAYTGNRRMQAAVLEEARITTVLCGHTHAACEATVAGKRCLNLGGDYDWKRLLLLDTGTGDERAVEFR